MMDKKPHVKPYLYGMLAGFGAISLSIIFFFLIYRFDGFGDAISTLTGILMPFIYGAVIAYLLKPVCNTIESFLRRFIPEKMHGLVNVLSVTLTILFGLLLIYALCMMIIPQLITSVTTLYYTAQRNRSPVQWPYSITPASAACSMSCVQPGSSIWKIAGTHIRMPPRKLTPSSSGRRAQLSASNRHRVFTAPAIITQSPLLTSAAA